MAFDALEKAYLTRVYLAGRRTALAVNRSEKRMWLGHDRERLVSRRRPVGEARYGLHQHGRP